jgi:hypothetical protein
MNDPYGLLASGLPPELVAQYSGLTQQQAIAQALLQQSQQPLHAPETKGRFQGRVSPMEGVAKIVQAYMGRQGLNEANQGMAGIASGQEQARKAEMDAYQKTARGTPEIAYNDTLGSEAPVAPVQAGVAPNRQAAVEAAMLSRIPAMRQFGQGEQTAMHRAEDIQQKALDRKAIQDAALGQQKMLAEAEAARKRESDADRIAQQRWQAQFLASNRPERQEAAPVAVVRRNAEGKDDPSLGVELVPRSAAMGRTPASMDSDTQAGMAAAKGKAKLAVGLPQARLRTESMVQNFDRLTEAMDELDADEGLSNITGTLMGRTPNITNAATGAQAKLNSIKSQIFQSALQSMREASKTGGAVGNVSDKEGDKLERTLAALDQAQSTDDFRKQLKKAVAQVKLSKQLIQNAFDEQYGGIDDKPAPAAGLSPAEAAELAALKAKHGR